MTDDKHEFDDDLDLEDTYLDDIDEDDENAGRTLPASLDDEDEEYFDDEENRIGFDDYDDDIRDELDEDIDDIDDLDEDDDDFEDYDDEEDY